MTPTRVRVALLLIVALVVQLSIVSRFRPAGVHADVLLLVALSAGLAGGPVRGAVVGFLAGLLADLFVESPFGLGALALCLVGFAVGSVQSGILRAVWWLPVTAAFVGSAGGVLLFALLATVVGNTRLIDGRLLVIAGFVAALNVVLSFAVVPAVNWALRDARGPVAYQR